MTLQSNPFPVPGPVHPRAPLHSTYLFRNVAPWFARLSALQQSPQSCGEAGFEPRLGPNWEMWSPGGDTRDQTAGRTRCAGSCGRAGLLRKDFLYSRPSSSSIYFEFSGSHIKNVFKKVKFFLIIYFIQLNMSKIFSFHHPINVKNY